MVKHIWRKIMKKKREKDNDTIQIISELEKNNNKQTAA